MVNFKDDRVIRSKFKDKRCMNWKLEQNPRIRTWFPITTMAIDLNLNYAPDDGYPSRTSLLQRETEDVLEAHLSNDPPTLNKTAHLQFLIRNLLQGFPARYSSQDASQPWLMFWTLQSFSVLQVGIDPDNKQK